MSSRWRYDKKGNPTTDTSPEKGAAELYQALRLAVYAARRKLKRKKEKR